MRRAVAYSGLFLVLVLCPPALVAGPAPAPTVGFDVSTPRRAVRIFIDSSREANFERAATVLDRSLPQARRRDLPSPAELARQLKYVLDQFIWVEYESIPDTPDGTPQVLLGSIPYGSDRVPLRLHRRGGRWMFTPATVGSIPKLYELHGPTLVERTLPPVLLERRLWEMRLWQWIGVPLALVVAFALTWFSYFVFSRLLLRFTARTRVQWDDRLVEEMRKPANIFFGILVAWGLLRFLRLSVPAQDLVDGIVQSLLIVSAVYLLMRFVDFLADTLRENLLAAQQDELKARGARTQVIVIRRVAKIILTIVGAALILIQFEVVRKVGMSLLASAGIAGVVIGLAAQRSIASILAGIQLAITQPIRIGDTVIVEGEWGWIEEINLTYVVVRVWDLRRLVVPISRFLEQPFQNWTKVSPDLLGTVFVHADYTVPVEKLRQEVIRYVQSHPKWDGVAAGLVVTDATEHTVQLRALVSAGDSGAQWDLRCDLREHLITYLRELDGGRYLPRSRWERPGDSGKAAQPGTTGSTS